jgi:GGDEF domain-containing protein
MSDDVLNPRLAERIARAARAAQALGETLWEALHEELTDPHGQRVAELSERLADVTATVALLARVGAGAPAEPEPRGVPAEPESPAPHAAHAQKSHGSLVRESPAAQTQGQGQPAAAVLVDELAVEELAVEELAVEELAVEELAPVDEPAPEKPPEIEIRDERGERDPTAWIASIGRRLERYERDGVPFAVLLIELADVERLRHAELPGEMARLTGQVETALTGELRPADALTRESPGRYWLLAQETDTDSARALAGRLAGAVQGAASHRGAPLEIAVGVAVCPADGTQAAALAARADMALYAARASGKPVA